MAPTAGAPASRSSVSPRALVWVVATLPLQSLILLGGSRRSAGEHAPIAYALLLGLAWLGCALGSRKRIEERRVDWIQPRGELFGLALLLMLLVSLATHAPRWGTAGELALGVGLLAALTAGVYALDRPATGARRRRANRLLLTLVLATGVYVFATSLFPSENRLPSATFATLVFVAVPTLVAWALAWVASRGSGVEWTDDLVRGRELRFSTRPGHAAAAFFLLALPFHDAPGAAAILPLGGVLLLVLFGLTASGPAEPDTPPCDLARWLLPLALPLVAAAALHLVEPPAVVLGKAASHGVAGVFFAALAPVLPALALAGAVAIDRVRGLRRLPGLGLVAVALLAALAFTAPWPQTELARLLGRELGSADGPPAWYGLPLLATYRAQALTCLALAAWLATRARRLFHEGRRPAWLPLVVAAAVTAFVAALRVPVAGAAGAAQASLVGALAGAAVESFGRRSPAPAVEPAPLGPS